MKKVPVLYLDLDGTVRKGYDELGRFVNRADDVELFPHMAERLWSYKQNGWRIIGITNQGGIALGHCTFYDAAQAVMRTQQLVENAFDKIMICYHHPDAKDPEYAVCWCRKPRIGMVVLGAQAIAADNHNEIYPPHLALLVGDRPEDEQCAAAAGITFMAANKWRELPLHFNQS